MNILEVDEFLFNAAGRNSEIDEDTKDEYNRKEYLEDFYKDDSEMVSNCCSAIVYNGHCTDCGEGCGEVATE